MSDPVEEEEPGAERLQRLHARPYQTELLNKAMERNIIVCLGTGTGKTFISVLLIKELASEIRKDFKHGGKRTFFLVNTVPLVSQQKKVIEWNSSLSVGGFVGEMGVDFWDDKEWQKQLEKYQVLVMTAQIFVDLLGHARIHLKQVNLIVFDECHHAKKEHPYAQVMKFFADCQHQPRILGLTASVVNGKVKPHKIESEIKNLERILRAACETSNDEDVEKFATKPKECVFSFDDNSSRHHLEVQMLDKFLLPWEEFLLDYRKFSDIHKFAKSIVRECIDTAQELGLSACNQVAALFLQETIPKLGRLTDIDLEDQLLIEYTATQLRQLQWIYKQNTAESVVTGADTKYLSPKVLRLVEILKKYGQRDRQNGLCGIVFVERRATAALLSGFLNRLAEKDPQLNFMKCNFVVGHGTSGNLASDSSHDMSWKKQEEILRKFRGHEFNLLVATSVVEEGLDIPKCNLVVRFDFPKTFQSYVQSKGRARAKPSNYILLTSSSDDLGVLEMYRAIEEYLASQCHDRPLPDDEDSCDAVLTDLLPPFKTSVGATLRMSNSISILNRYCSKLPGDTFTPLYAEFNIEDVATDAFQATVKLPMNCPIKEKLEGEAMPSKKQAKMAAAYKACKKLYEIDELDERLLPVEDLSSKEDSDMDLKANDGKPKRGTKRSRQVYQRKVPTIFKDGLPIPGKRYFLYAFSKKQPTNNQVTFLKFGILITSKIPEIRPFLLYQDDGLEAVVSIHEYSRPTPTKLSSTDISLIDKFNSSFISELLRIPCETNSSTKDGYYVVPLSWDDSGCVSIDFEEIREDRLHSDAIDVSCIEENESLITPHHRPNERFIVEKICTELCPSSPFPEKTKAKTYDKYFLANYKLKTTDNKQPLLLVKRFPERINFLVNRKKTKREVKESRKDIHFIPEHCTIHPFPASLLHGAAELPSILHRINSILLVGEVIELIAKDCSPLRLPKRARTQSIGQANLPPIGKQDLTKDTSNQLQEWFSGSSQRHVRFVDTFLVLQAITTKSAGDAFDLERLEMLGDAFLKQAVSNYLYCSYHTHHEGKLTKRKSKEVSNLNLFKASNGKELPVFMQNTALNRKTWLTPCLYPTAQPGSSSVTKKRKQDEEGERCSQLEQCISDKSVADSIEALIGAYLISCGYRGALSFLDYLGVKVFPESDNDENTSSSKYANFGVQKITPLTADHKHHKNIAAELRGFEETIQYKFKDKMFLVQALTHASYQQNILAPDCYQRLEFLGDAVLDFLVTEFLYSGNPNLSPGELTDLRQALVNNNIFAKIAVEYNYHKYLKYSSPQWFKKINDFVLQLEDDKIQGKPQVDDNPFVIMSDDNLGAVEAPKVLGDIFESVAGAVFLDSGMDVVETWRVYYRMMKPYIHHYSKHVPLNPIRLVHENDIDAKFSEAKVDNEKIYCELTVRWGVFTGNGANKKFARLHAAQLAMDALKQTPQCT